MKFYSKLDNNSFSYTLSNPEMEKAIRANDSYLWEEKEQDDFKGVKIYKYECSITKRKGIRYNRDCKFMIDAETNEVLLETKDEYIIKDILT